MDEKEAIARLKDHFAVHDDGRPTPSLDKAANMAIKALKAQIKLKEWVAAYNQPEFKDIIWNTEEVIGLLNEFMAE